VDYDHPTHAHIGKALEWIERIRPKRAFITHMGSRLDYEAVRRAVPAHVIPAHDGLVIEDVR
jgi:phosphoribosyl 1,2-cyclic phosphate phosphodiesterase